jgi:hypothetical protein
LLLSAWTRLASADVTITERVSQDLAGVAAKFTQVQTIRGLFLRVEDDASEDAWIYDAAAGVITRLDAPRQEARTYDAALAAAEAHREPLSQVSNSQFRATGRTHTWRGRLCHEYRFFFRVPLRSGQADGLLVKGSAWLALDGAGLSEYLAFHRRAAERGMIFSDAAARGQDDSFLALALVRARTELARRIVAVEGMPWAVALDVMPERATVLGPLDRRLRGRLRVAVTALTTDEVSSDAFVVPSSWQSVDGEERDLYRQVRDDPDAGRIRVLGRRLWLGVGAGVSALMSGAERDRLGGASWSPAFRLVGPLATQGVALSVAPVFRRYHTPDFSVRVLAATAGLGVTLVSPRKTLVPFVAARTGPYVVSLKGSSTRLRPGCVVEWGASYRRRLVISGSYEALARAKGVSLSNWSLNAIVRVY